MQIPDSSLSGMVTFDSKEMPRCHAAALNWERLTNQAIKEQAIMSSFSHIGSKIGLATVLNE